MTCQSVCLIFHSILKGKIFTPTATVVVMAADIYSANHSWSAFAFKGLSGVVYRLYSGCTLIIAICFGFLFCVTNAYVKAYVIYKYRTGHWARPAVSHFRLLAFMRPANWVK